jgi:site-specific recombinase XerD
MDRYLRSKRHPELFRKRDGGPWWAFVPNPIGKRKLRETTGLRDEHAAHAWYLERLRIPSLAEPTAAKKGKQRRLEDALVTRIAWLQAAREKEDPTRKKLSKDTIDFYMRKSKRLVEGLGADTLLSAIGHEQIRSYIVDRSKTVKATSIGKELTALSMAMRLARKDGIECPVFADIVPEDFQALYVPRKRWLSEEEVDRLLAVLAPKRAAVVAFIVATSATYPSEVAPVRPEHVKANVVHLLGTKRSSRNRYVHVPPHAHRFLKLALKHLGPSGFEPWTNVNGDLKDAVRLLSMCADCRKASLAWARHEVGATKPSKEPCRACKASRAFATLSPNDLRRTFAQWLVRSGVPHELTYPMMGHNSPRMLEQVYGKRDAGAVAELVQLALKRAPKNARRAG